MSHNHTAYAREDVADARTGHPSVSLAEWGGARGLGYRGQEIAGAFATLAPRFADYWFNICRGQLVAGRFGQVAHELDELASTNGELDRPGEYYGTRLVTKRGIASMLGVGGDGRPDEPFAANAAWVPTTSVIARVPEQALRPRAIIRTSAYVTFIGNPKLDDQGLPGLRWIDSQWIDDTLRDYLVACASPLAHLGAVEPVARYVEMTLDHGLLKVQRNGFTPPGPALDTLVAVTADIAGRLSHSAPEAAGFGAPLPAPDHTRWPGHLVPQEHEVDVFARAAAELGMQQEDAVALHVAFPRLPFPGRALGVVAGRLPGSATAGRIAFAVQGRRTSGWYRTVVMVPARPGAVTAIGGHHIGSTDQYIEVSDGIACCWPRARSQGRLDAATTAATALVTLRETGLADV